MVDFLCYLYTMSLYIYIYIQSGKLLADFLFDVRGGGRETAMFHDRSSLYIPTHCAYISTWWICAQWKMGEELFQLFQPSPEMQ